MTKTMTLDEIHRYWTSQACEHGLSSDASWSDRPVIELEIREILKWISDGDTVLDVGCANGFSTLRFAAQKAIHIRGVDYIPEMIEAARSRLAHLHGNLVGSAEFDVGDITCLAEPDDYYDKVIVVRVIINLGDWPNQQKGLLECVRILKRGGILILSEATFQGWSKLNRFRQEWGLPQISMPGFNNYLDEDAVVEACSDLLELVEIANFASTYYVGTRVLKPLLVRALGANIDVGNPNTDWNLWFSRLPPAGDYGTQKLFVFRKKA